MFKARSQLSEDKSTLVDDLIDRKTAAKLLGVSPRTLDRWHLLRGRPSTTQARGNGALSNPRHHRVTDRSALDSTP
jgi:hypothetical protein